MTKPFAFRTTSARNRREIIPGVCVLFAGSSGDGVDKFERLSIVFGLKVEN
jgi:hypothetical protein